MLALAQKGAMSLKTKSLANGVVQVEAPLKFKIGVACMRLLRKMFG